MSEQKLVSPLLDGFQVGDPISSHDGVRCCPAIKENSDHKYIVKILSIPASQSQLDALLLAGAFQDAAGALEYFKDLADGVVQEVKLHQQLARLDGFVPCESWQVVPMEDNQLGYEVYLLTPYHRTLDRHLKKTPLTHLEAVNLGLDLCAALTASRRAGHLYVDLKPSNIFIASDREFLIGDLGFMRLDSLKYAALPTKYRSVYTAPEMGDALATISDTADIYALGLILYQVYNDGQLPAADEDGVIAAPANADYEMAEIILKACAADPAGRWQDPAQMGQALVSYMQRNTVNDVPIMPPDLTPAEEPVEEPSEEPAEEPVEEPIEEEAVETAEDAGEASEEEPSEEPAEAEAAEEEAAEEVPAEESAAEEPAEAENAEEETEETEDNTEEQTVAAEAAEEAAETAEEEETAESEEAEEAEETVESEESAEDEETEDPEAPEEMEESSVSEELAFMDALESDEALPEEEAAEVLENAEISEEASEILALADKLAALEVPEPVVVTAPQLPEEDEPEEPAPEVREDTEDDDGEDEVEIPLAIPDLEPIKKTGKKWLIALIVIALLAGAAYGGNYYYRNYYLVPVESIVLDGSCDEITAEISVPFDETKLTAVCTDTYGNTATSAVEDGKAHFTGLNPGSQYTVTLRVEGFNQLTGNNTASFTTDQQTKLVSFTATTGAEDGSVILSFTVDGYDPQNWTVEYAAAGEDVQSMDFTGHMVTIPGLTVGAAYTFTLVPTEEIEVDLVGETTLDFTASKVLLAQNVGIGSFEDGVLTVVWTAPEDAVVTGWTVRCTAEGYDESYTVTEPSAKFEGVEIGKTYTIEILADGMTQSSRTEITATPLTMSNLEAAVVNDTTLRVTWEFEGDAPAGGWSIGYSIDGGKQVETLTSDTNAADLPLVIPGASYEITVQGVDTAAVSTITFETPEASKFKGADLSYSFCVTPSGKDWDYKDVKKYTTSFKADQSVSMVIFAKKDLGKSGSTNVLYVVRDADGTILSDLCAAQTLSNKEMWRSRYFYPTLPKTPSKTGTYTFELYFDGELALSKDFKIVK